AFRPAMHRTRREDQPRRSGGDGRGGAGKRQPGARRMAPAQSRAHRRLAPLRSQRRSRARARNERDQLNPMSLGIIFQGYLYQGLDLANANHLRAYRLLTGQITWSILRARSVAAALGTGPGWAQGRSR